MHLPKSQGFTLIELIVVIVILGIMAAIAGPKFVNLQTDARISVMDGVEGAVRSTATLVYSKSLIEGEEGNANGAGAGVTDSQVVVQGATIETEFGYPTAQGLLDAMELEGDVAGVVAGTTTTFTFGSLAACTITYDEPAGANTAPTIVNNADAANC